MKPKACAVALVAMAGTLCAASVFAEESVATPTSNEGASTMRVVVDPATGEVRAPTADELKQQLARERAATSARAARAAAPSSKQVLPAAKSVQRHPNGMLSVRMSQETLSLLKAVPQADGKIEIEHANETAQPAAMEE